MSMILLEPANTILQTSGEDQAADHLINGNFRQSSNGLNFFKAIP
jgi:hypothetical protein